MTGRPLTVTDDTDVLARDERVRQVHEWQGRLVRWCEQPIRNEQGEVDYDRLAAVERARMILARLRRDLAVADPGEREATTHG
jgi:hypothetical protein